MFELFLNILYVNTMEILLYLIVLILHIFCSGNLFRNISTLSLSNIFPALTISGKENSIFPFINSIHKRILSCNAAKHAIYRLLNLFRSCEVALWFFLLGIINCSILSRAEYILSAWVNCPAIKTVIIHPSKDFWKTSQKKRHFIL